MNVRSVDKLSVRPHALFSITECTGKRNTSGMIMREASVTAPISSRNKMFSAEKKSLTVMHGRRTSVRDHISFSIKEPIPKRDLTNAVNVGRHLVQFRPRLTSEFTLRAAVSIPNVVKPSVIAQPLYGTRDFTPRNPLNVTNVKKLLVLNS
jgi:hypothetical protein